ncbi:MAG: EVE domain-containing protein [Thermomicrobiales bacterium]
MADRRNWIIVGSPDNFVRTAEFGFTIQGIKSRHRKKAEKMAPGDRMAWYITGHKAFAGTATIESEFFEDHEKIWSSVDPKKAAEDYPYRFRIAPDIILGIDRATPAEPIARQMVYATKWPAANWTLAFQGNVHEIGDEDFALIRDAVDAAKSVESGGGV